MGMFPASHPKEAHLDNYDPSAPGCLDVCELVERLSDLRKSRNLVERTMSGLRPDEESPLYHEWEAAMGHLARMHAGITDLILKTFGEAK